MERPTTPPTDLPTSLLVDLARRGEAHAGDALFRRYRPVLESMARSLRARPRSSPDYDADDLVQETMAHACANLHELRDEDRFRSWLASILRHASIRRHRHERRAKREAARALPLEGVEEERAAALPTPSACASVREEATRIAASLRMLDEDERALLLLRYDAGLSNEEMARELDVSSEALRKRLSRARARLGLLLGGAGA